jgi:hypothetical protein
VAGRTGCESPGVRLGRVPGAFLFAGGPEGPQSGSRSVSILSDWVAAMLSPMHVFDRRSRPVHTGGLRARTSRRRSARRLWAVESLEGRVLLSTIPVNTFQDLAAPVAGLTSLREAIAEAANLSGDDVIDLPAGTYNLTLGPLTIADSSGMVTIESVGGTATINAGGKSRVFEIAQGTDVTMQGLAVTNGMLSNLDDIGGAGVFDAGRLKLTDCMFTANRVGHANGGSDVYGSGGGLYIATTAEAELTECSFVGNWAGFSGGGLYNLGNMTVEHCTLSDNSALNGAGMANNGTATLNACNVSDNGNTVLPFASGNGGGIGNGGTISLTSCTLFGNGNPNTGGGGLANDDYGSVTLTDCTVSANVGFLGGGLVNQGTATIVQCVLSGNSGNYGGGLCSLFGTVSITDCTISNNTADLEGGGVFNQSASVMIAESTLSGNTVLRPTYGEGGGLSNRGQDATATLIDSTISGNSAWSGGGVLNGQNARLKLVSCTVTSNSTSGVENASGFVYAVEIGNTIVAGNISAAGQPDVSGYPFRSHGFNLIGVASASATGFGATGDQSGTAVSPLDPKLGQLQDNGGPTFTHALLPGSPALDRGDPALAGTADQRGVPRPQGPGVDIGAFELAGSQGNVPPTAVAGGPYTIQEGASLTLDASASTDADGDPLTYSWAFNGDNNYSDAAGVNPILSWTQLQALGVNDGPQSYLVTLRLDDGHGNFAFASTTLQVLDTPPTATLSNTGPVLAGIPVTVLFSNPFDPSAADMAAGLHYAFSTDLTSLAGTAYATSGTSQTASFAFDFAGTYTVYGRLIDKDGMFSQYSTTVTVTAGPTAVAGGPYTIYEGSSLMLDGSASTDPNGAFLNYAWALNGDSNFSDASGVSTSLSWAQLQALGINDGPRSYPVTLRVSTASGSVGFDSTTVQVLDTAPQATLSNGGGVVSNPVTVRFTNAYDPSAADMAAGLHYAYSTDPSSLAQATYATGGASSTTNFIFNVAGNYTVYGRVIDKDGGFNDYSTVVTVSQTLATINGFAVNWGSVQTASLMTNSDGLRLLPPGRNTDMPWLGINRFAVTLSQPAALSPADVSLQGINVASYGPVTVAGSGANYVITLAAPISAADRVTVTIANATIATYTRRLDILPGDVNDDGTVNVSDVVLVRNMLPGFGGTPTTFGDINGSGAVDMSDYNAVRARVGTTLPGVAINGPPTAVIGGPYAIAEGSALVLDASASSDPDGDPLTFTWDLNGDGNFTDGSGAKLALSWAQLQALGINDGPMGYPIAVRVDDGHGHAVVASTNLQVANTSPTASLSNSGPVLAGNPVSVTFSSPYDPSAADMAAGLHFAFSTDPTILTAATYANSSTSPAASFTFLAAANFTVYGRVIDKDGGFTNYSTIVVTQTNVNTLSVAWGTLGASPLQTAADGLRLLPAGRSTDLPWLGINRLAVTLNQATVLSPADVSVTGIGIANYGPVTISGAGTSYIITFARPISDADRVTVVISNPNITTYTRRLDVLPGDVNDDGVVDSSDVVAVRNMLPGFGGIVTVFGDINGDGVVDINDYNAVRNQVGKRLP